MHIMTLFCTDVLLGEKYAGCRPGPKLTVHFTGLVKAPEEVWLEQVTGHSALVVWKKGRQPFPVVIT